MTPNEYRAWVEGFKTAKDIHGLTDTDDIEKHVEEISCLLEKVLEVEVAVEMDGRFQPMSLGEMAKWAEKEGIEVDDDYIDDLFNDGNNSSVFATEPIVEETKTPHLRLVKDET